MNIDRPWLKELRDKKIISLVETSLITEFYLYLDTLHWFPQSLDWRTMPSHESFRLEPDKDYQALPWIGNVAIGKHSHIAISYARNEPGLMCTADVFVSNLGPLFAGTGGKNYMFGMDRHADGWKPDFRSLMEFDGHEVLTAVI
jgi:hypothetical protein